jgi:hypothetical protein
MQAQLEPRAETQSSASGNTSGPLTVVVKAGVVEAAAVTAAKVAAAVGSSVVAVCRGCRAALARQAEVGP